MKRLNEVVTPLLAEIRKRASRDATLGVLTKEQLDQIWECADKIESIANDATKEDSDESAEVVGSSPSKG